MKLIAVSVFDKAVNLFARPFFVVSIGQASRSFVDEVNRNTDDNPMNRHAKDYALYVVGEFDEESGLLTSKDVPYRVLEASEVLTS